MIIKNKSKIIYAIVPFIVVWGGCNLPERKKDAPVPPPPQAQTQTTKQDNLAKRFDQPDMTTPTAIDSAIELSEKYAKLSKEAAELQKSNQQLIEENKYLKEKLSSAESQLQQARKDLSDANNLLFKTNMELNKWKSDVLGFRQEIRDAQKAQLEALYKILMILGAESKEQDATAANTAKIEDANTTQ